MNEERFIKPFLSRPALKVVLSRIAAARVTIPLAQFREDFFALRPADHARLAPTLELLARLGILEIVENGIRAKNSDHEMDLQAIVPAIVASFRADGILADFAEALQVHEKTGHILVDPLLVPWRWNHVRQLLLELSVLQRDEVGARYWTVAPEFSDEFLDIARTSNVSLAHDEGMSLRRLKALQETQARLGAEAEEWVLKREKIRLSGHKFINLVKRVSAEHVDAGYDITSFSSVTCSPKTPPVEARVRSPVEGSDDEAEQIYRRADHWDSAGAGSRRIGG